VKNKLASRKPLTNVVNGGISTLEIPESQKMNKKRPLPADAELPSPTKKFNPNSEILDTPGLKIILAALSEFLKKFPVEEERIEKPLESDMEDTKRTVWVSKWVDYSQKYGLGYVLRDGSIGVSFIDRTKIVQSANEDSVFFIDPDEILQTVKIDQEPIDPRKKKRLILHNHFKEYLHRCDASAGLEVEQDWKLKSGSPLFIRRWIKSKDYIAFFISNDSFQINFFDHSKIIVSKDNEDVILTLVEKNSTRFTINMNTIDSPPKSLLDRTKSVKDCISEYFGLKEN